MLCSALAIQYLIVRVWAHSIGYHHRCVISDISIECFNRHMDFLALCAYAGVANDVGTGKRKTYGLRQLLVGLALLATRSC